MRWDTSGWDHEIFQWYRSLTAIRHARAALRGSHDRIIHASGDVLIRRRIAGGDVVWLRSIVLRNRPTSIGGSSPVPRLSLSADKSSNPTRNL